MTLAPRSPGLCPTCGNEFRKEVARETYCSLHCAVWRYIDKREPDDCWPWIGATLDGYGAGGFRKRRYRAHRVVLAEKLGIELPDEMQSLHRCDNRRCCNPDHLFMGTNADNMADKKAKGRGRGVSPRLKGTAHGRARLSEDAVKDIWRNRPRVTEMAQKYGVPKGTAHGIMRGKTWAWLTASLP